jgi:peptidoglycan/xylan/chitin deacetylase (PgdA/CDA1 family)
MKPAAYGPFPYTPIRPRPKITWPNGARVALWVIPNIEFFALNEKIPGGTGRIPDVSAWAKRDYGNRVGVFRMMEVMARHGVRGTVALNSDLCDHHPQILEKGVALGWEFMGHNESNTRRLNEIPPDDERRAVLATLDRIEAATGTRPVGWLGSGLQETWNSLDHLAEGGVRYVADWVNDDQPYLMKLESGASLVSLPYSIEINDKPAYEREHRSPDEFEDMIKRQFDTLYQEGAESGRVMAIALHPYLSGVAHRIGALDAALDYICRHDGVWRATGREIVEHYLKSGATF